MRKEIRTITTEIYKFNELTDDAKEKVKGWFLNTQDCETFTDMCEDVLYEKFKNSKLDVQYSLASCQGDGFNIYGVINFNDLLDVLKDDFADEEKEKLNKYFEYCNEYKLDENKRYYYCIIDRQDFIEDLIEDMKYDEEEYDENLIEKFNNLSKQYLCKLCADFEKDGYDYFYEISDEELEEICESNNYEFTEDGIIY